MFNARFILALLILAGAALAACSGNLGAGTSSPGGLLPSGSLSGIAPTSSPTPTSASNIVTYGDSTQFQPLPQAAGYGGAIAFDVPSPRPSGFAPIPIGVTLSLVAPADVPDLNLVTAGKKGKHRERPARQLVYISLLATHDVTLAAYPRIAVDVPRDVVTTYREDEINLGLFDAAEKDKTYRLAVSEHDTASPPPPPAAGPTAPPPATPIPVSAGSPGSTPMPPGTPPAGFPAGFPPGGPSSGAPGGGAVPGSSPSPATSPTLPPQRILFAATARSLKLVANSPVIFAVYALPVATPSPAPSGASPAASGSPAAAGSPVAGGSPTPAAAAPSTSAPPSGSPAPART